MVFLFSFLTFMLIFVKIIDSVCLPVFLIFMTLKLCGIIAWSWVMICLPLICLAGSIILTIIIISILTAIVADY